MLFVRTSLFGLGVVLFSQIAIAQSLPTPPTPMPPDGTSGVVVQPADPGPADAPAEPGEPQTGFSTAVDDSSWTPSPCWRRLGHAPGGDYVNGARVGLPYYYNAPGYLSVGDYGGTFGYTGWGWTGYGGADPYVYHFGPGIHRHTNYGHYRFPFHTYRAPWYFKGAPSYNRDTNHPW